MRFPYFKFPLHERSPYFGNNVLKPIIPIRIAGNTEVVDYAALIDSGADFCIIHAEIGEIRGLSKILSVTQ